MAYRVNAVSRNTKVFRDVVRSVFAGCRRLGPGRHLAMKACLGEESSRLVVAFYASGKVAGAATYRRESGKIKLINIGSLSRHRGIGTAIMKFIVEANPATPMWSKNTPEGSKFVRRALGMKPAGSADGYARHKWSKAAISNWLREVRL